MGTRWAALAGVLVVALIAFAAWRMSAPAVTEPAAGEPAGTPQRPAASPSPEPAATSTPEATSSAVPEATATAAEPATSDPPAVASRTPVAVAPPTPSPATPPDADGAPLVGSVQRDDDRGDLADSAGQPPAQAQPAADLTAVVLSGDGRRLQVEFALAGSVPARAGSLVWSLDVWIGTDLAYTVTVQKVGGELAAGVLDWESGEQAAPPDAAVAEGATVSVSVPADMLARVDGPFQWQALGQADGGYEDFVPADGVLDWFPRQDG